MKIKDIIDRVLYYVSVPKCVACKEKLDFGDHGLCKICIEKYERHKQRNCPRCSRILSECFCSYEPLENNGIKNFVKIFRYSRAEQAIPSNYLIYSLKQDNRRDVLSFLSEELAAAIKNSIELDGGSYIVTNVPRRKSAIVNFGYDHAKALAMAVSERLGLEYVELLSSKSKKAQKNVYGAERLSNARFEYKCDDDISLKGKSVILIDDIVTTGASLSNCAALIKKLKPRRIIGACLGTAYKEPYINFDWYGNE